MLSKVAVVLGRWHPHRWINWRGRCWAIRSTSWSRVVLASAPAEANARVANGIALHLVDGHLSSMALNELNKTAALSRWNLDVSDLAEALEERAELVLSDITG